MKKNSLKLTILSFTLAFLTACGGSGGNSESQSTAEDTASQETKYKVYKAPPAHDYPNASIQLEAPTEKQLPTDSVTFRFDVINYELGVQTPDAEERNIANSDKGQHIHFIVDNDPYSAHYVPEFKKKFNEGRHVVLAFLSRSYHESVKNDYVLQEYVVGGSGEDTTQAFDMDGEHLFYSRPKGTYSGEDTEKLMLDFFLVNTQISEGGNKVRATINGEEHILTEWAPYFIEGLEKGTATIKLELINNQGEVIPGKYNTVTREVTLE